MTNPTAKAMQFAASVANANRATEASRVGVYTDAQVQLATVHAREDIASIYVMQGENHKQLVAISRGVWALVMIVGAVAFRLTWQG